MQGILWMCDAVLSSQGRFFACSEKQLLLDPPTPCTLLRYGAEYMISRRVRITELDRENLVLVAYSLTFIDSIMTVPLFFIVCLVLH